MTEEYWAGALWIYQANITNDGSNSGSHIYDVVPGAGNEFEVLYGRLSNDDTAGRNGSVTIEGEASLPVSTLLRRASIGANTHRNFPVAAAPADLSEASAGTRFIVAGTMTITAILEAVAVSQDSAFAIVCRIRGRLPTVTLTSPTDAVETIDTNQVF